MEKRQAEQEIAALRKQITYHNQRYYVEDNPEIAEEITAKIYAAINDKKSDEEDGQTKAPEEQ